MASPSARVPSSSLEATARCEPSPPSLGQAPSSLGQKTSPTLVEDSSSSLEATACMG
jgi:hypothetical protein